MTSIEQWEEELNQSYKVNTIDWVIQYLQALKDTGETHVFSIIYDRADATHYYYDDEHGKQVTHEEWKQAVHLLSGQDYGLGDEVANVVEVVISNGEAKTN